MNRPALRVLTGALLLAVASGLLVAPGSAQASPAAPAAPAAKPAGANACAPSPQVLKAVAAPVAGLSAAQVQNATAVINAAAPFHVPERGQTVAVMTALEASSLGSTAGKPAPGSSVVNGLFGPDLDHASAASQPDPGKAAAAFYQELNKVKGWQNMPPTLAAHAAVHNLNPNVFAPFWSRAVQVVNALTTGTGAAGLANLAARAQAVADCEAATVHGRFSVDAGTPYVGPVPPTQLVARALDLAKNGGNGWHDWCQKFVAVLAGRASSGYSTALDAWQTFEAQGVAHPVTGPDGTTPPVGAWLYYASAGNPAGHVDTYLGNGQIASTDVFANGRVGVGPASAITNGPWHLQYLGWAPPWGQA